MIIKSKDLLLFEPDALKVEHVTWKECDYYIMAYKNNQKFYIKGYESEYEAREVFNKLSEYAKNKAAIVEI